MHRNMGAILSILGSICTGIIIITGTICILYFLYPYMAVSYTGSITHVESTCRYDHMDCSQVLSSRGRYYLCHHYLICNLTFGDIQCITYENIYRESTNRTACHPGISCTYQIGTPYTLYRYFGHWEVSFSRYPFSYITVAVISILITGYIMLELGISIIQSILEIRRVSYNICTVEMDS